jgi:hypothetical protein
MLCEKTNRIQTHLKKVNGDGKSLLFLCCFAAAGLGSCGILRKRASMSCDKLFGAFRLELMGKTT